MKKTILITGSTDGIGKLAAIQLAKEGHEIYLHGRNSEKLTNIIAEIKELSHNEKIAGFVADFSSLDAVRKMAQQLNAQLPKIDVLINNAGVFKSPASHNQEGMELRFMVNYLAPYVLTSALIPLLNKSEEPRIINLSSAAQAPVSYDAITGKTQVSAQGAYAQSKLALTMWSFHLARNFPNITVIAVNPGSLLNTNMVREGYGTFWAPADKGADILYDLAISAKHQGATGKYYDNDKGAFGQAHSDAYVDSKIDQLIQHTEKLLAD